MARAHLVPSSRVAHRCGKGHDIPSGEGYYWAAPGFRARKQFRCLQHPFRPSELTTSAVGEVYAAQEQWSDTMSAGFDSLDDIQSAYDEFSQALTDYRDMRQEALDAWEYGNSQLEEYLDTAEEAVSEIEGWSPEDQSWDGDEEMLEDAAMSRAEDIEDKAEREAAIQEVEDARQEHSDWLEGVAEEADQLIYGLSL